MVSMRQQIEREFAASKVERMAAQKMESIKQVSARLRTQKEQGKAVQDEILKNPEESDATKSKRQARKRKKRLNREIDLKHYDGSAADKLLDLIAERKDENRELITILLDRLWRRNMNGGILKGKDFEAIDAAKAFLREVDSKTS